MSREKPKEWACARLAAGNYVGIGIGDAAGTPSMPRDGDVREDRRAVFWEESNCVEQRGF